MNLSTLDISIIGIYFVISLVLGLWASRKSKEDTKAFFLAGRSMPWWLLGTSMVATTFSTDTPNLVTDLVRGNGVAGNWGWWAFLLTGMLTVFVYAKLWHRLNVLTDIEFYEIRYSGKAAAFLRGFRALYLGLVFNVLVMGSVCLAGIKFGEIVLGWPGWFTLLIANMITLIYSTFGGLKAVLFTDFFQFIVAMAGSIAAMFFLINLPDVGGLTTLLTHPNVTSKLALVPDLSDPNIWVPVLFVPIAIQWWATYYPGAEPGGGGYIAQRMFAAKNENHAVSASLLFNIAHYAIRPWPWILVALASLVIFPQVADIQQAFPNLPVDKLGNDVAYPAMLTFLPTGLLGLVAASLIAAFMSTMSTQVNLGASYLVNDFYHRFINKDASEKQLVRMGQYFTVLSLLLGSFLGLLLKNAAQAFSIMLMIGAGTGLLYILRWFWWRINAYTEIVAMAGSLVIAVYLNFFTIGIPDWKKIVLGALLTTSTWFIAAFFTPADDEMNLRNFVKKVNPGGPGWAKFRDATAQSKWNVPKEIYSAILGCVLVYSFLFGTGELIYQKFAIGFILYLATAVSAFLLYRLWNNPSKV